MEDKAHSPAVMQDSEAVTDAKEAVADAKAAVAAASGDGDDCPMWMTRTQFVVAYKRLSQEEVDSILPWKRKPFQSTDLYKDMIDDSSTSKEDLEHKAEDHKYSQDRLFEWQATVRKECAEKGIFAVDDNYIGERFKMQEYFKKTLSMKLAELNLDDSIFGDE